MASNPNQVDEVKWHVRWKPSKNSTLTRPQHRFRWCIHRTGRLQQSRWFDARQTPTHLFISSQNIWQRNLFVCSGIWYTGHTRRNQQVTCYSCSGIYYIWTEQEKLLCYHARGILVRRVHLFRLVRSDRVDFGPHFLVGTRIWRMRTSRICGWSKPASGDSMYSHERWMEFSLEKVALWSSCSKIASRITQMMRRSIVGLRRYQLSLFHFIHKPWHFVAMPLKLLDDYINRQPPWTIERGSSLCQWNINYYFLKFKNTQTNAVMMHWSLPDAMAQQFADLKATFATQEAKQGLYYVNILRHKNNTQVIIHTLQPLQIMNNKGW